MNKSLKNKIIIYKLKSVMKKIKKLRMIFKS